MFAILHHVGPSVALIPKPQLDGHVVYVIHIHAVLADGVDGQLPARLDMDTATIRYHFGRRLGEVTGHHRQVRRGHDNVANVATAWPSPTCPGGPAGWPPDKITTQDGKRCSEPAPGARITRATNPPGPKPGPRTPGTAPKTRDQ